MTRTVATVNRREERTIAPSVSTLHRQCNTKGCFDTVGGELILIYVHVCCADTNTHVHTPLTRPHAHIYTTHTPHITHTYIYICMDTRKINVKHTHTHTIVVFSVFTMGPRIVFVEIHTQAGVSQHKRESTQERESESRHNQHIQRNSQLTITLYLRRKAIPRRDQKHRNQMRSPQLNQTFAYMHRRRRYNSRERTCWSVRVWGGVCVCVCVYVWMWCACVLMDGCVCGWICVWVVCGWCVCVWMCACIYVCMRGVCVVCVVWMCVDVCGCVWMCVDVCGCVWMCVDV